MSSRYDNDACLDHQDGCFRTYFLYDQNNILKCLGDHLDFDRAKAAAIRVLGPNWVYKHNGVFMYGHRDSAFLLMMPRDSDRDFRDRAG